MAIVTDTYVVVVGGKQVSLPSRTRLLWLDVVIIVLQITMTLISFNVLKAESSRRATSFNARSSRRSHTNNTPRTRTSRSISPVLDSMARNGGSSGSHPRLPATNNSNGGRSGHSTSSMTPAASSSSGMPTASSSGSFSQSTHNAGSGQPVDATAEYYEDDEEVRYSLDNPQSSRAQHSFRAPANQRSGPEQDHTNASVNSEDEEEEEEEEDGDNLLEDDYEDTLEQETFVLQVQFKDLVGYLASGQEAMTFSRISDLRTMGTRDAEATRVQNLPV